MTAFWIANLFLAGIVSVQASSESSSSGSSSESSDRSSSSSEASSSECSALDDFLSDDIILREHRPNIIDVGKFLNASFSFGKNRTEFGELASVFDLGFHEENVARLIDVLKGLSAFAGFNASLTQLFAEAESFIFPGSFFGFREVAFDFVSNLSISTLRLQFTEILTNTCDLDLSTEQQEAIFDLFETDVRALTLAAVECGLVEVLLNSFLPAIIAFGFNGEAVLIFFLSFACFAPTNFATFAVLFLTALLNVASFAIPSVQEDLKSAFFDGIGRCVANISDELRTNVNDTFSFLFVEAPNI